MNKFLGAAAAALILGGATSAFAGAGNPASDTASATATVISALTVTKTTDLAFGKVVAPLSGGPGHLVLAASAAGTRTPSAGLTLVGGTTGTAAVFTIAADTTSSYAVTVTSTALAASVGANPALVWTPSNSGLPTGGALSTLYIGGDITVPANAAADTYTGSVTVSALYN